MAPPITPPVTAQVYTKKSFLGGMNQQFDMTKIKEDEYPLLFNGRSTFDKIKPVRLPSKISNSIFRWTIIQGIFATDTLLFVFADGKAYWKDVNGTLDFKQIIGFNLDPNASAVYTVKVPASSMNFVRKADSTSDNTTVLFTDSGQSYPSVIIVQDGTSQPMIISDDLNARVASDYNGWTQDNREYVPIGKNMLFFNSILYIVSSDGRKIYRSVTGRPADFMVVIDSNGDKLADITAGNADAVSYQVDYNPITALHKLNTNDGSFFASTTAGSYAITPSRDVTIFGEPTFKSSWLFPTNVLNQNSFVDITGDSVFISPKGVRSFNAVYSTKWEGKNTPFSKKVYGLFNDIKQTITAAILFDEEHVLFACDTVYGPAILVYDIMTTSFESLDIFSETITGYIVDFAQTTLGNASRLFCYTTNNEVFELYSSSAALASCKLYLGEWVSPLSIGSEQKVEVITIVLNNLRQSGTIYATLYVDSYAQEKLQSFLEQQVDALTLPTPVPFVGTKDIVRHVNFPFINSRQSWKVGFFIEWDFDAELIAVEVKSSMVDNLNCNEAQASELEYYTNGDARIETFAPVVAKPNEVVHVYGSGMQSVVQVFVGDAPAVSFAKIDDTHLAFVPPNIAQTNKIKLQTVANNKALSIIPLQCIQA